MNPACAGGGYTMDLCCLIRAPDCFDEYFTFEFCCPGAAKIAPYFGDPHCFLDPSQVRTFDRCCVSNDDCFTFPFTRQRCCGEGAQPLRRQCDVVKRVKHGVLGNWSRHSRSNRSEVSLHFGKLIRVTSVTLSFSGHPSFKSVFQLLANGGLGMRPLTSIKISSRGEPGIWEFPLDQAVDVYSLTLSRRSWRGDPAVLYFGARGCPAVNKSVVVLHCQPERNAVTEAVELMEDLYDWLVIKRHAKDPGACFEELDVSLRELQAQKRLGEITVLLSPYLRSWHLQTHSVALWRLTQLISSELAVLGLPCGSETFVWPLRRLRRQYWKLQAVEYPTGSARYYVGEKGSEVCHGGDVVSASRVYKSSVLEKLLEGLKSEAGAEWLLNLDLEALVQGVNHRSFLCAIGIFDEDHYLQHVHRLTSHISLRYGIEAARLQPEGLSVNCAVSLEMGKTTDGPVSFSDAGLVTPWCFRRCLRKAWRELTTWWSKLSPRHFVAPSDGTGLSLLRNLEEPIPWDHDVDVWLFAATSLVSFGDDFAHLEPPRNPALQNLSRAGFKWTAFHDYRQKGGGFHVEMQFLDVDSGVTVDLDVMFKGYYPRSLFPLGANLFGTQVVTGQQHIHTLARKYGSAKKLHRSRNQFRCSKPGHPACIPATESACEDCDSLVTSEFPDRFVLLDWFE